MSVSPDSPRFTRFAVFAVTGVAAVSIAACSSNKTTSTTTSVSTSTSTSVSTTTSPTPAAGEAKVSGLIASVSGNSLQVAKEDNTNATVNFTASTKITEVTPAALTGVTSGGCVKVRPTEEVPAGQPVTAASVRIIPAVNGTCPQAKESNQESAAPSSTSAAPGKPMAIRGTVASVSGNTINVTSTSPSGGTTQTKVTVNDRTKYTKLAPANTDAVTQGKCVTARGTADSSGALQATSMRLRPAVDGKCATAKPAHGQGG